MNELNRIHLNGLRAVEAVFRLGSLQAAADALGVSPGAVSQQVIRTEGQLGRALFERKPKGLVPVDAALPALERLTEGFDILSAATGLARRRDDNVLTVSVAPIFASRWLVHRLSDFSRRFPDIRLRMDASLHLVSLSAGDIEVAIRVGLGNWSDTDAEFLVREDVFPVCAPALAAELHAPQDLYRLPILIDQNSYFGWDAWTRPAGLDHTALRHGAVYSDDSLCLDAAIGGQGVALVWNTMARFALENGQVVEPFNIRAPTGRATYFVTPKGHRLSPAARVFKRWLREQLGLDD